MSSKTKKTDPSSRAKSTSTLNSAPVQTQPLPPHPSLSSFNSTRTRFAAVVSAGLAGGQRLRCWDTVRGGIVREWDLPLDTKGEKRGVRSIVWATLRGSAGDAAAGMTGAGDMEVEDGSSKKKRKRKSAGGLTSESGAGAAGSSSSTPDNVECVVIVQASTLFYYSPEQSGVKSIKTISLGTTPCAILPLMNDNEDHILTVSNSTIEVIDPNSGSVHLSTLLPDGFTSTTTPSLALSLLDSDKTTTNTLEIVIASTQMTILTLPLPLSTASKSKIEFTRPQSISLEPVRSVVSIPRLSSGTTSTTTTRKFVTVEEDSRVATVWAVSEGLEGGSEAQVETIGTIPTDTSEPIHTLSIHSSTSDSSSVSMEMFLTSLSGQTFIYSIEEGSFNPPNAATDENPNALVSSSKKRRSSHKKSAPVVTLKPISTIVLVVGGTSGSVNKEEVGLRMVGCMAYPGGMMGEEEQGEVLVGWMAGPGRIVWDQARYKEMGGDVIREVKVVKGRQDLVVSESAQGDIPLQRFKESTSGASNNNATRSLLSEDEKNLAQKDLELPVEGDLADLTLGERLAVLEPDHVPASTRSDRRTRRGDGAGADDNNNNDVDEAEEEEGEADQAQKLGPQSTQSLTRLLLQALHTSDPSLLTLILTSPQNSTPGMIRNTIRKLPASMALPLLKACVERLGKGRGFERRGGGRGGGLSGKEGGCVVAWIRGVLVERGSILMTIPSLPVHLASLSQLLQSRLQLHTPLLSLSGRLDLALAQIELRKSLVPPKPKRQGTFYVEGESETDDDEEDSDEDEDMDSDVEIEGDEEDIGEVEDVRLESRRETESRSAGGDEDEADGEIRVRALNGRGKGKAAREVLVASDDEDEEEDDEEDEDDEEEDDDEYDEDDDSEDDRPRGLIDDEAMEASDDEDEDEDMEE